MRFTVDLWMMTERELKKWYRQRVTIIINFITPLFWLGLFGKSLNFYKMFKVSNAPPEIARRVQEMIERALLTLFGTYDYFTYMAAGMFSIFILFIAMFSGLSLVFDRRLGYLYRLLAAPIRREAIFLSKVLATTIKGLAQFTAIFIFAVALGLKLGSGFGVAQLAAIYLVLGLLSIGFASIFVGMSSGIESHDAVIAIANLLNLPLMFTSNALFPTEQMPEWLQAAVYVNPITYATEIVRMLILMNIDVSTLTRDLMLLTTFTVLALVVGMGLTRKYLK